METATTRFDLLILANAKVTQHEEKKTFLV